MIAKIRALHRSEMTFFKSALIAYNAELDDCGDIRISLGRLKKKLDRSGRRLAADKWARLYGVLMSGEVTRGKRSTPGDWAAQEVRLFKASLRGA